MVLTWVVLVFGAITLCALVMMGCFAVWLWRKAVDLLREGSVLMERADELIGLLEQIGDVTATPPDDELSRGRAT